MAYRRRGSVENAKGELCTLYTRTQMRYAPGPPVYARDTTMMYKVLQINGQQTGRRELRINERNFGTCGMLADAPRFICIQACTLVHSSSSAVFTRVPLLFPDRENGRRDAERGRKRQKKGTEQDTSSALSSAAR